MKQFYGFFLLINLYVNTACAWPWDEDLASKATKAYRNQHYDIASRLYQRLNTPDGYYNQGNAEAKQGHYQAALEAYQQSLLLRPNDPDTLYNKNLIENLLKKQNNHPQKKQNKPSKKNKPSAKKKQNKSAPASTEQRMEKQFLNMVPDDPGGLLKQKFLRDHLRRLQGEEQ